MNGLPFPLPGYFPDPGIKPGFLASPELASRFFTTVPPGKLSYEITRPLALRMDAVVAKLGARPACRVGLLLALTDAAPLSAPAFSLVFPFLKMVLTEMPHHSEEEEERMAQILQILTVHAQLRASPSNPPGRVDEVGWGAQLPLGLSGVAGGGARASDTS